PRPSRPTTSTASPAASGRYCDERMEPGVERSSGGGRLVGLADDQRQSRPADRGKADFRAGFSGTLRRRSARPASVPVAAWRARPQGADRPARSQRAANRAPFYAAIAEELRDRQRPLSARLLHDEAQPAAQRENG